MMNIFLIHKAGHLVTVYERNDRIGGLLTYGIPTMKLDKRVSIIKTFLCHIIINSFKHFMRYSHLSDFHFTFFFKYADICHLSYLF